MIPFTKPAKTKTDEPVIFAFVVFTSRAHRDRVNGKVMKDPRLAEMMDPESMPFHCKKMIYGGFSAIVDAWRRLASLPRRSVASSGSRRRLLRIRPPSFTAPEGNIHPATRD